MGKKKTGNAAKSVWNNTSPYTQRGTTENAADRLYMSVREMGDLLGLKKTDRYWLLHKGFFETRTVAGKTWIEIVSFEKWYANQVKYHKVTGEEPGKELKAWSYSPREIAEMLDICEQGAYELIRKNRIETIIVDYWMRIPKDAFQRWYKSQSHYKTAEDREKESALVAASVSMPEMAKILGVTRQKIYTLLKDPRYQHFFDIIEIGGRRRITRDSLQRFLDGQDQYRPAAERIEDIRKECSEEGIDTSNTDNRCNLAIAPDLEIEPDEQSKEYITIQEAAEMAGISRQALTKYIDRGRIIGVEKYGGKILLPKQEFGNWLIHRTIKKEESTDGID